jgi:hypothetical protein
MSTGSGRVGFRYLQNKTADSLTNFQLSGFQSLNIRKLGTYVVGTVKISVPDP